MHLQNMSTSARVVNNLPGGLPIAQVPLHTNPETVALDYVQRLQSLKASDFTEDALWRDTFAFTGTVRTFHTPADIKTSWNDVTETHKPSDFALIPGSARVVQIGVRSSWVEARFVFKTNGIPRQNGSGFVSLIPADGEWKIWLLRTILEGIDGLPDVDVLNPTAHLVPNGHQNGIVEPTNYDCVVVGAGQAGLAAAGRLKALGVQYLLIDKNAAIGDNWLLRYESAKLHTVRNYAHLPFERTFTPDWKEFLPKRDVAKGFEIWFNRYGINAWFSTNLESGKWDEDKKEWAIRVIREGKEVILTTKHLVLAVGGGGQIPRMPTFPDREKFKGVVLHSVDYTDAKGWRGKKGVVVGAANTAHDVAEDMQAAGMDTTMVQRQATYVVPTDYYLKVTGAVFNDQIPIEIADRIQFSNPIAIGRQIVAYHLHKMIRADPERFDSLERAGFLLDRFGDITYHVSERGGGHYMDVGGSGKISKGLIKMKSDALITAYTENGLLLSDGSELKADVIVFTTGFVGTLRDEVAKYLGQQIADQVDEYWGLDTEGEIRGAYKPIGHPGLWYTGGTLGHSRFFSRFLGLQIRAALDGTPLPVYEKLPGRPNMKARPLGEITEFLAGAEAN
ncbi:Flavin-binding monooxygenase-like family protein [Coccidioides posadasii C735 delta SOWgp]|uniref:Flavin-binding monooxygenase-like family protein n=1 Tax=Coccidioides posadasii (strain C735) TaxID=222929 RepID=C5PIV2_COCP7|nr:Flavin-binding monooxygenase-like family protein [Coccidioides posadasii C735 delta SOWgp]EER24455.1 Flavin-binding monooxygenase-like family protein [Coccidioides posadasii C735 delta SOWgp]|eukprot:XP_003066600.1 Flavin-binding monooxygenase-like family protein [Coccidioides posadasii C735 delta SOWgp]